MIAAVGFLFASCTSIPKLSDEINLSQPSNSQLGDLPPSHQQDPQKNGIAGQDQHSRDSAPSLRVLAQMQGLEIGTAVQFDILQSETIYTDTIAAEFSLITPENEMKFDRIQPEPNRYFWAEADALVAFAESHGLKVRGHTLAWHSQIPQWLKKLHEDLLADGEWSPDDRFQFMEILWDHIKAVVGRYRGRILAWDVVNEAVADDGCLRESIWLKTIGPEYLDLVFRWAHEADPEAILIYNDYGFEKPGLKFNKIYSIITELLDRNVPLHGIGFQMHLNLDFHSTKRFEQIAYMSDVLDNMTQLAELGLLIHITELDVAIKDPLALDHTQLVRQANLYRDVLQIGLCTPNFEVLGFWGFTDKHSWLPWFYRDEFEQDYGAGLILDGNYQPKPAYDAIQDLLTFPSDSDGDGISNCEEVLQLTDPFG
jgi:endo-1,4-beta-xylanase